VKKVRVSLISDLLAIFGGGVGASRVASLLEDEAKAASAAAKLPPRPKASPFSTTFVSRSASRSSSAS
jgi:hypothetical protein